MTGALTWARLSYRQQRWELLLVAVGVAGMALAMLWFASQLDGLRIASPECVPPAAASSLTCTAALNEYSQLASLADNLLILSFGAPFGIGVLLGAPLVAREIDGGTAQLVWSIGRSRVWWLVRRIGFVALFVVLALAVIAVTSEILAAALVPERDLSADFTWFGRRGWLIVARGVGALMLGMLVGAVIGRVLPAILAAALATALVFTGISLAMDRWNQAEATVRTFMVDGRWVEFSLADLAVDYGLIAANGSFASYDELYARGISTFMSENGIAYASEADHAAGLPLGEEAQRFIHGSRYPEIVRREAGIVGGLALVTLVGTAMVVARRRPA